MIRENELEGLRHSEYNSDKVVMEMLDTLEALWKVARVAEILRKKEVTGFSEMQYDKNLDDAIAALQETEK